MKHMGVIIVKDLRNIYYNKQNNYYYIHKMIGGKRRYYGCFKELSEAIQRRDELRENEWSDSVKANYTPVKERIARMFNIDVEEMI